MDQREFAPDSEALISSLVSDAQQDINAAQQLALDASRLLTLTQDRLRKQKETRFFGRCWAAFSSRQGQMQRANEADLIGMQAVAWRYLEMLQKQNLLQAQSVAVIRNNLLAVSDLALDTQGQISALIDKLRPRLNHVEKISAIHGWLLTVETHDYADLPEFHRMLRVVFDFSALLQRNGIAHDQAKGENYLVAAFKKVGLDISQPLTVASLIDGLLVEAKRIGLETLEDTLSIHAGGEALSPEFILDNVSGAAFSSIFLLRKYLPFASDMALDAGLDETAELLRRWARGRASISDANYSLEDIADEIIAGIAIAVDLYFSLHSDLHRPAEYVEHAADWPELNSNAEKAVDSVGGQTDEEIGPDLPVEPAETSEAVAVTDEPLPPEEPGNAELAATRGLPVEQQEMLLEDEDDKVLVSLAGNPSLVAGVQMSLSQHGSPATREALAANAGLHREAQAYLLRLNDDRVNQVLGSNPALAESVQISLAAQTALIRCALARNPSVTPAVQAALLAHPENSIQRLSAGHPVVVLAKNPSLTQDIQAWMATSCNGGLLEALASNPTLPFGAMVQIASLCAGEALAKPDVGSPFFSQLDREFQEVFTRATKDYRSIRTALAANPSLPATMQLELVAKSEEELKTGLCQNPSVSEPVQALLMKSCWRDEDLAHLARNPSLTVAHQSQLADLRRAEINVALSLNPSLHKRVRRSIIGQIDKWDVDLANQRYETARKEYDAAHDRWDSADKNAVLSRAHASSEYDSPLFKVIGLGVRTVVGSVEKNEGLAKAADQRRREALTRCNAAQSLWRRLSQLYQERQQLGL